ncbi:MAG: chemotaxis protein MotC [Rhizobiaceae bacterium]
MSPRHMAVALTTVAAVLAAPAAARAELAPLEPYQMVRSLQLVQDRIADGDHAALPMQRKLIELIDERLGSTRPGDFKDQRNFRALLVYAMSGGNPRTVERIVSRLSLEGTDARLSAGVLEYLRGQPGQAANALGKIDPRDVSSDVAAFLALIKGSIAANDNPAESLAYLDLARMMGPGTLVEEAALRRSTILSAAQREADRFLLISEQYVRRFLSSPYASQFADAFVDGVANLHGAIDLTRVAEVIDAMNMEQGKVIYLRLARRAAIDQHTQLLAFARAGLEGMAAEIGSEDDPRAILYSTIAAVTIDDVDIVRTRLESIDSRQLSAGDRMLLDAAFQILDEVTSQPAVAETLVPRSPHPAEAPVEMSADAETENLRNEPVVQQVSAKPDSPANARRANLVEDDEFISETRRKLESIDKMLEGTSE